MKNEVAAERRPTPRPETDLSGAMKLYQAPVLVKGPALSAITAGAAVSSAPAG